ncbi:Transcription factor [Penicillium occitanis (nom. inval.)]|nr:Transcription factor [Penicillium occitanis (nom. inval.)]PCG88341.1 hypothetical protein PENOC_111420 [Penicillium occitanis (nom. inval.)]
MHGIRIDSQGAPEPRNVYCSLIGSKSRSELTQFFNSTVNVCFPLFQRDTLLKVLELENTHPLPRVVHGISAKLIGDSDIGAESKADSELRQWVQWVHAQKTVADSVLDPKALYEWQTACLLTWYGFHQRLGTEDEMHMAISNLTRKAYRFGLHQIDSSGNRGCYGWDTLDEPKLEDWRRVWWCVFSLDSYSTFSTATPTQVEAESIQTALPLDPKVPSSQFSHSSGILLPTELHGLPAVTQDIRRGLVDKNFGLHMVVNSLLKEAVAVHRLSKQNPGVYISGRISALRDHLSALQLTLPPNYMRPTSDFIGGELLPGFNSRLQTQLKIHSIRVLLSISALRMDPSQWLSQWQENLEICFRMFEVIQQWDTQSSLTVDPAVCFIAASLLIMLHLHSLSSAGSTAILHAQLTRRKEVLRLFLQNYALYWRLPQFLLGK